MRHGDLCVQKPLARDGFGNDGDGAAEARNIKGFRGSHQCDGGLSGRGNATERDVLVVIENQICPNFVTDNQTAMACADANQLVDLIT